MLQWWNQQKSKEFCIKEQNCQFKSNHFPFEQYSELEKKRSSTHFTVYLFPSYEIYIDTWFVYICYDEPCIPIEMQISNLKLLSVKMIYQRNIPFCMFVCIEETLDTKHSTSCISSRTWFILSYMELVYESFYFLKLWICNEVIFLILLCGDTRAYKFIGIMQMT